MGESNFQNSSISQLEIYASRKRNSKLASPLAVLRTAFGVCMGCVNKQKTPQTPSIGRRAAFGEVNLLPPHTFLAYGIFSKIFHHINLVVKFPNLEASQIFNGRPVFVLQTPNFAFRSAAHHHIMDVKYRLSSDWKFSDLQMLTALSNAVQRTAFDIYISA